MTRALALELAPRVRVNAIAPSLTASEMTQAMPAKVLDKMIAGIPLGRMAEPEEIAETIAALASPAMAIRDGPGRGRLRRPQPRALRCKGPVRLARRIEMVEMLIAGERTEGRASEEIAVVDPATEETIETVPRGSVHDVDARRERCRRRLRGLVRRQTPRTARTCCARRSR